MSSNKKLNIVMLSPFFYPHKGGVEHHVFKVSKELLNIGNIVTIITTLHEKNLPTNDEIDGIKIIRLQRNRLPVIGTILSIISFFRYTSLIRRASIIHCHDYQMLLWFMAFRILFPFKKVFITFHGWEGDYPPKRSVILLRKIAEFLTNGNICIGGFIEKWYNTKADLISYGGVDTHELNGQAPYSDIILLSRISEDIPIREYLASFKLLKEKYNRKVKIFFLGNGELLTYAQKFASDNNLDISFLGFVDNPIAYIKQSKIIIANGYLAILESAAYKKPIFAIYQNELMKDRLALFKHSHDFISISANAENFASKINKYFTNPELQFNFERPWEWARDQSWANLANQYLRLWGYKNIINRYHI